MACVSLAQLQVSFLPVKIQSSNFTPPCSSACPMGRTQIYVGQVSRTTRFFFFAKTKITCFYRCYRMRLGSNKRYTVPQEAVVVVTYYLNINTLLQQTLAYWLERQKGSSLVVVTKLGGACMMAGFIFQVKQLKSKQYSHSHTQCTQTHI